MEIINVRIDERLIHGQVATMWNGTLKPSRIMVVDNYIINSDMQKSMLKMACPYGVKLSILNTQTAANNIQIKKYLGDRIFLIVKGPETLVELYKLGVRFDSVTIGNMSSSENTRQLRKSINITREDQENFEFLDNQGIKLIAQMVPSDNKDSFMELMKQ
jgi:PTS system mannose-specific IIB component